MKCPECGVSTYTIETRNGKDHVYRRHRCPACEHRFSSREFADEDIYVVQKVLKLFRQAFPDEADRIARDVGEFEKSFGGKPTGRTKYEGRGRWCGPTLDAVHESKTPSDN